MARCGCGNKCSCVIDAVDTTCSPAAAGVDMNVSGLGDPTNHYKISATVPISTNPDNQTTCDGTGIFTPASGKLTVVDTDSVDHTLTGTGVTGDPYVLKSDVFIQDDNTGPLVGKVNALKLNPGMGVNGLYIDCEVIQDCVGEEVGTNLAGTCLVYDDVANKINVEIADTPTTNGVKCTPSGLEVIPSTDAGNTTTLGADGNLFTPGSPTVIHAIDNAQNIDAVVGPPDNITFTCVPVPISTGVGVNEPCLSVSGDTCNGFHIELGISGDPCQGLECRGNGLFAPTTEGISQVPGQVGSCPGAVTLVGLAGIVQYGLNVCSTITNTNQCRSMRVFAFETLDNVIVVRNSGALAIRGEMLVSPGGFSSFDEVVVNDAGGAGGVHEVGGPDHMRSVAVLPPGGSVTVCLRTMLAGNALGGGPFTGTINACYTLELFGIVT